MTIALRYLLSNPTSSPSSFLTSQATSEDTKTLPVEKGEEKEDDKSTVAAKESQKELEVPVKDLKILKRTESSGEMLETDEGKRTPESKKPLNKSLSVSNVGNGGGKITGQRKSSNLTGKTKQSSLPPASSLANGRKENIPALKLTVKYNKITSILSLIVHKGRVSTRYSLKIRKL